MDDLRPPGTVEVKCSHPGCNTYFWLRPSDPRLPDGPFSCGSTHEDDRQAQINALPALFGINWGGRGYKGPRSDGKEPACRYGGEPAGYITFVDKWAAREGILHYEDISVLDDPLAIPDLITWHPPGISLDDNFQPVHEQYPRMGGSYHAEGEDGKLAEHKLVLHQCPRCLGSICLETRHPLAFRGTPTCGDAEHFSGYTRPCPAGAPAFELDPLLEATYGPGTCWTIWERLRYGTKNLAEGYLRGQVLVRKATRREYRFALLIYDDPGEILRFAPHLRFDLLENLPLEQGSDIGAKATKAIPFVRLLS